MAKQFESGHAINVENFYELTEFVQTYGASYNPILEEILPPALNALHTQAVASLQAVTQQVTAYNAAVNQRMQVFAPSRPLATRVVNLLEVSGASPQVVKDAQSINRKIQGRRAKSLEPVPPGTPPPATISASQTSYTQTIGHWAALISLLESVPAYAPNEDALKVTTLKQMHTAMVTANDAVAGAWAQISDTRNKRDNILYNPTSGLVATAAMVKKYVKALYGAESPQFKQLNHIAFKTFKRL